MHKTSKKRWLVISALGELMLVAEAKIFADHYQFYIFDSDYDHYSDSLLDWTTAKRLDYGYLAADRAIYVSTVADLNTHRIRVFLDEPPSEKYERMFSADLHVEGNSIQISAPANDIEDDLLINVGPGRYKIYICSRNIGVDELMVLPERDEPLEDEEFLKREDIESYDLYIQKII